MLSELVPPAAATPVGAAGTAGPAAFTVMEKAALKVAAAASVTRIVKLDVAAVVGVPDEMLGQAIRAFVVREPGRAVSMKDVLKHCSENLEPFLVPHDVVFQDELPKSPTGKIDRAELKSRESPRRTTARNQR